LTDKFAIGDLTAEEVSRLGIIDSIIAGEEKQKKIGKDGPNGVHCSGR
jgi:hypothetical protein